MASNIPKEFIQTVLSRSDIIDIVDSRVPLKRAGSNYQACCPFHQEKSPSFTVSPNKQFYHCFGCGEHGNAISFLMNYDRMGFVEAVEYLAKRCGLTIPYEDKPHLTAANTMQQNLYQVMGKAAAYYQAQLASSPKAHSYLLQRGLSQEIIELYCLGFAPAQWDNLIKLFGPSQSMLPHLQTCGLIKPNKNGYFDLFRDRIMFPIRNRKGQVVAFGGRIIGEGEPKYLNSPETAIFFKSSEVYGLYEAVQANRQMAYALIVEGYMDVIALCQHGFSTALACMGTAITRNHIERIARETQTLIFCFDGDTAGTKAAWRAANQVLTIMKDGIIAKFIFLPESHDPDSFIREFGNQAFQQAIDNAIGLAEFFWQHLLKETDTTTLEGKAKLSQLAKPYLDSIPESEFKKMMQNKLQHYTGIAVATSTPSNYTLRKTQPIVIEQQTPLIKKALAMLIQYPELIDCTTQIAWRFIPAYETWLQLLTFIKDNPGVHTANIIEAFRDSKYFALLNKLATLKLIVPESGLEAEFLGILTKLQQDFFAKTEEKLLAKLRRGELTSEEKSHLLLVQRMQKGLLSSDETAALLSYMDNTDQIIG